MKTIFKTMMATLALVLLTTFTSNAFAGGDKPDAYYVGKAHSEVGSCIGAAHGGGPSTIVSYVQTVSVCFVSGYLKQVSFYQVFGPPCHQEPCPRPFVRLVATVDFGCDDEIVGSTCY
jgi:hypothetical protein